MAKQSAEYFSKYYRKHKRKIQRRAAAWYKANRPRALRVARERAYRIHYGLTFSKICEMKLRQKNRCAICGLKFTKRNDFVLDHDHVSLQNRALLHRGCNVRLAVLEDAQFVQQAKQYLKHWRIEWNKNLLKKSHPKLSPNLPLTQQPQQSPYQNPRHGLLRTLKGTKIVGVPYHRPDTKVSLRNFGRGQTETLPS